MRKYLLIALGVFVALSASFAGDRGNKKAKGTTPLPPFPELSTTLDSIIQEAWILYYSERVNWIASDLVHQKYREDGIGGCFSWLSEDSVQCVIFFDNEKKNCILELKRGVKPRLQDVAQGQDLVLTAIMMLGTFPSLAKT